MCFNTQPPEGGWPNFGHGISDYLCFNTQPPEGGWSLGLAVRQARRVSTHSRPKAAGGEKGEDGAAGAFQHTAARRRLVIDGRSHIKLSKVSTHSRPKAAGPKYLEISSV